MVTEKFKVLFSGRIIDGFDAPTVRAKASRRLKASPEQISILFSGRSAVLKKGIGSTLAERYVTELRAIGMEVFLDPPPSTSKQAPVKQAAPVFVDMEKTQLVDPGALAAYLSESSLPCPAPEQDAALIKREAMMRTELPDELPGVEDSTEPEIAAVSTLVANPNALSQYVSNAGHFEPMALPEAPIDTLQILPLPEPVSPVANEHPGMLSSEPGAQRSNAGTPGPFGTSISHAASLQDELLQSINPRSETPTTRKKLIIGAAILLIFVLAWWLL